MLLLKLRPIHNHRLRGDGAPAMQTLLAEAGFRPGDGVRIAYTFEDLEAAELRELHRLSDGYVTATYGEGFGGPVVEALILGRPVICAAPLQPRRPAAARATRLEVEVRRRHVGLAGNSPIYPHASSWGLPVRGSLVRAFRDFAANVAMRRAKRDDGAGAQRHAERLLLAGGRRQSAVRLLRRPGDCADAWG